ncbi:envelope glycoprotein precursor [Khurdun virus]|uniref:Envelopment polyprotein n=1 Tax=Khurdun virus TaxID=1471047 RepID=W8P9I2_9VIRU|nr:envelope glycoprotein precursor [Khurdun virus]AHL27167.1 envelope glycoprotein precursor [Khurdun virus]
MIPLMFFIVSIVSAKPISDDVCRGTHWMEVSTVTIPANLTCISRCLSDDFGYVKVESSGNTCKLSRKYTKTCSEVTSHEGYLFKYIMTKQGVTTSRFMCTHNCEITVNQQTGEVSFASQYPNFYKISIDEKEQHGFFNGIQVVKVVGTCVRINAKCGSHHTNMKYCFKKHRECYNFLSSYPMPLNMVNSFCNNLEIIIMISFILLCFILLRLIARTPLIVIFVPVLYFPVKFMYYIKAKFCVKCKTCKKAWHFFECEPKCICGNNFSDIDRYLKHKKTCKSQRYGLQAYRQASNRITSLFITIILALLFFSYVIPIASAENTTTAAPSTAATTPGEESTTIDHMHEVYEHVQVGNFNLSRLYDYECKSHKFSREYWEQHASLRSKTNRKCMHQRALINTSTPEENIQNMIYICSSYGKSYYKVGCHILVCMLHSVPVHEDAGGCIDIKTGSFSPVHHWTCSIPPCTPDIKRADQLLKTKGPEEYAPTTWDEYIHKVLHNTGKYFLTAGFEPVEGMIDHTATTIASSIQGEDTGSEIKGSYIEFPMKVLSGIAHKIKISKEDKHLFDLFVRIVYSNVTAPYNHIYSTGPTETVNVVVHEKCTGECPRFTLPRGMLPFKFSKTSNWGCEDWGCLAIQEGCIWGGCSDVLSHEKTWEVYKKVLTETDTAAFRICVYFGGRGYCKVLTAVDNIISDTISITFNSKDWKYLPEIIAVDNIGHVRVGAINDLSDFSKRCGDAKIINTDDGLRTITKGEPVANFKCHSASAHEVVINKCGENSFDLCNLLEKYYPKTAFFEHSALTKTVANLGSATIKLNLGDVKYTMEEEDISIDGTCLCSGCMNCPQGVLCNLKVVASVSGTCTISSTECPTHLQRTQITAGSTSFDFTCMPRRSTTLIPILLCKRPFKCSAKIITTNHVAEIIGHDNMVTVEESDKECNDWFCKAYNEVSGWFNGLSKYGQIALWIFIAILVIGLIYLVLIPFISRINKYITEKNAEFKKLT